MNRTKRMHCTRTIYGFFLRKEYAAEGRILGCLPFFVKRDQDSFFAKRRSRRNSGIDVFSNCVRAGDRERFSVYRLFDDRVSGVLFFWKKTIGLDDFAALFERDLHIILYALSVLFEQMAGRAGEYAGYIDGFIDFANKTEKCRMTKTKESMAADSRTIQKISMEHVDFGLRGRKSYRISVFR